MSGTVIFDGKGYWVARRRVDESIIDMWSPKLADAAVFHFDVVARKIAATIPQRVSFKQSAALGESTKEKT